MTELLAIVSAVFLLLIGEDFGYQRGRRDAEQIARARKEASNG